MASQQEVQWSQLKVGILVVAALLILTALIFLMSGSTGGLFTKKLTVRSYFENSSGLKVGAPVNLEGVSIGNVKSVKIVTQRSPAPVEVTMKISRKFISALHPDSRASLETVGVLGDTVVDISSKSSKGGQVKDGDELPTTETPNLSDVIKSSQGTIEQVNTILGKVDQLADSLNGNKGSIGSLINDPTLYNKANSTLNQLQQIVEEIGNGKGSIGKLIADDTLYDRANATVGRLQHISDELDNGQGTLGKLLKDDALYNNLRETTQNANQLLANINAGKGSLGMLAKDPRFAAKLNDSVTKLDSLLSRMDSGEGTIGKLMRDPALYNHSDEMISNTNRLVNTIRENPKKYLSFHVKIF
ncbi:MlaD family protein [Acidipila rosea]|uniref:Phospholipid/cholesterol/gamma-HCH transport system substrate-binding protein n=1 Tax=Acidipila rosea TaxID=768535 RepID=A0A4R1KZ83_9BACT|nr:MlaD family protein [Acidipila rosea]TCK70804.1 phospholipid/cholesterol/gamma-HCH transport system substrate-binding protein [Acidipila rosea]